MRHIVLAAALLATATATLAAEAAGEKLADLEVSQMSYRYDFIVDPAPLPIGSSHTYFTFDVTNSGTENATGVTVRFTTDVFSIAPVTREIGDVLIGETRTIELDTGALPYPRYCVTVNPDGSIPESDQTNNRVCEYIEGAFGVP